MRKQMEALLNPLIQGGACTGWNMRKKIRWANHVIENIGTPDELFESVADLYAGIKKEFLTRKT